MNEIEMRYKFIVFEMGEQIEAKTGRVSDSSEFLLNSLKKLYVYA